MARVRSPNYPSISLPAALEKVRSLHSAEARNPTARDVIAKHLGFGGINGASATMLSALGKYGLIEPVGEGESRVSDLAMRILFPHDASEKERSLREAAFRPALFGKINEKWPDQPPSDESLRAYLIREGFSPNAADQVIQFYRETLGVLGSTHATPPAKSEIAPSASDDAGVSNAGTQSVPHAPPPARDLGGRPFTVAFDGSVMTGSFSIISARDIDRLIKVLEAQKAAFEAMQDDPWEG